MTHGTEVGQTLRFKKKVMDGDSSHTTKPTWGGGKPQRGVIAARFQVSPLILFFSSCGQINPTSNRTSGGIREAFGAGAVPTFPDILTSREAAPDGGTTTAEATPTRASVEN
jgi:hypothetical protein